MSYTFQYRLFNDEEDIDKSSFYFNDYNIVKAELHTKFEFKESDLSYIANKNLKKDKIEQQFLNFYKLQFGTYKVFHILKQDNFSIISCVKI